MGHTCEPDTLVVGESRALEQAIVEAMRGLKEKALLLRQLAAIANPCSPHTAFLIEQADQDDEHVRLLDTHLLNDTKEHLVSIDPIRVSAEFLGSSMSFPSQSILIACLPSCAGTTNPVDIATRAIH